SQTNVVVVSPIVLSGNRFPLVPVDPRHCRITQTSGHQQALIPQESSGANPALALSVGEFCALAGQEPGHWAVWPSFSKSHQHADEVVAEPNVVLNHDVMGRLMVTVEEPSPAPAMPRPTLLPVDKHIDSESLDTNASRGLDLLGKPTHHPGHVLG